MNVKERVRDMEHDTDFAGMVRFHGHLCPGLAIGYRAAKVAMQTLGAQRAEDEELIAIVENDSCSADAIQYVTGCTFGKGNLFFRDYGKQVFTLALRPSGRAVRIALKAWPQAAPESQDREVRTNWLLQAPVEDLFDVKVMPSSLPEPARIRESVVCDACGEAVMITRTVERADRTLCIPCSKEQDG
jgi:formylmethanofuran dehydrogenase subunit E